MNDMKGRSQHSECEIDSMGALPINQNGLGSIRERQDGFTMVGRRGRTWKCDAKDEPPVTKVRNSYQALGEEHKKRAGRDEGTKDIDEPKRTPKRRPTISALIEHDPGGKLMSTEVRDTKWVEHTFTVDSGACEHVTGDCDIMNVPTREGPKARRCVRYEVANGDEIANLGEKACVIVTPESKTQMPVTMQVCDVHKSLLAVGKITKSGKKVVFDEASSYIEDKETGERLNLKKAGNLWTLKA